MTLENAIERLKAVSEQEQERALLLIIERNKAIVLDLNTKQLFEGRDSQGKNLQPPYKNAKYAELKRRLNPAEVVDLRLTGAFHDSFFINDAEFPVTFGASDEKTGELVTKYGPDIFGLSVESKTELNDQIREEITDYYKREVYGL